MLFENQCCPLVSRVRVFLSSEHFILFYSAGFSKVGYFVPYLWFLCFVVVFVWQWINCFVMCKGRCCHHNHTKSDQSNVDIISNITQLLSCEYYTGEVDCYKYRAMVVLALWVVLVPENQKLWEILKKWACSTSSWMFRRAVSRTENRKP